MFEVLIKVIPLDFAAILSPGILALAIVLLGSKFHPKLKTVSLFVGTLIVAVGIALLGFTLGQTIPAGMGKNSISAIVDLVLGIIFILFGVWMIISKQQAAKSSSKDQEAKIAKWFFVGFVISITNFDAVFFSFTAAREVSKADIGDMSKIIILVVNILFFSLPIWLPLILYLILPDFAERILAKINVFVLKYSKYILFILFLIFGLFFAFRGIEFFI